MFSDPKFVSDLKVFYFLVGLFSPDMGGHLKEMDLSSYDKSIFHNSLPWVGCK